jgi:subfamily B ATP-binding cassette protein MsbA
MDSAKDSKQFEILKRVFKYVLPYKGRLAGGVISMLVHAFLTVFFVRVFQGLLETIISDINMGREGMIQLSLVAGMMILVYFLKGVSYYGKTYLNTLFNISN